MDHATRLAPLLARAAEALRAGRPTDAIEPLRQAAVLQPGSAAIHHDFGLACLETGLLPEAVAQFEAALGCRPDYIDAQFRLGIALEGLGDVRAAIVAYDRATELLPSLTEAWYRAGALVFTLGYRDEAIGCFRRAAATGGARADLASSPGKPDFRKLGRARALLAEARDIEAERVLRQVLARAPGNAIALDLLGNVLAASGRLEEARQCFARAIASADQMVGCYYDLVRCRRLTAEDADLPAAMQAALDRPGLAAEPRIRVHLALGRAADDLGDPAMAMAQFDAAWAIRSRISAFDLAEFARQVELLIRHFPAGRVSTSRPQRAAGSPAPVLIVGMPRSGTTLVEQILSSHPSVEAGGELNHWNEHAASCLPEAFGKVAGTPGEAGAALAEAARRYVDVLRGIGPGAALVTDKMPFNFLWAGLIHRAFPDAVIIHIRRCPIDTALSIHQTLFNPRTAFPTGGAALVGYFRLYQRLTAHWRRVLPPDRFIEIDYETLVRAPEPVIRQLLAAIGLDWDESCLRPERNLRIVRTPSRAQVRMPINRDSIERWRHYEPWLGPLAALLDDVPKTEFIDPSQETTATAARSRLY